MPYENGSFDLVVLLNMIPFFDELGRVTTADGTVVISFSFGAGTPIYVPRGTLEEHLRPNGFVSFEEIAAGSGTALIARKGPPVLPTEPAS